MKKTDGLKAPRTLPAVARKFWLQVAKDFELERHHETLLTSAATLLGRAYQAREILDRDGLTVTNRFHELKEHPMVAVERASLLGFKTVLREMGLDVSIPSEVRGASRLGTRGTR